MDDPGSRRGGASGKGGASGSDPIAHPSTGKGVPTRARNAEAARKAILDAAEEIFAEHGFDGARVDLIAERSGYNKSLIFQYFGDKLNLYAGVIRRADDVTRETQNRILEELLQGESEADTARLKDLMASFVGTYFDYMLANPNFLRIINWELAEGWQTYAKVLTERDYQDVLDFTPPLQRLMERGFLRSNFNPMAQIVVGLFVNHIYLGILPFLNVFLPNFDAQSPERLAQAREFLINFIVNGLIADSPNGAALPSVAETPKEDS